MKILDSLVFWRQKQSPQVAQALSHSNWSKAITAASRYRRNLGIDFSQYYFLGNFYKAADKLHQPFDLQDIVEIVATKVDPAPTQEELTLLIPLAINNTTFFVYAQDTVYYGVFKLADGRYVYLVAISSTGNPAFPMSGTEYNWNNACSFIAFDLKAILEMISLDISFRLDLNNKINNRKN